MKTKHFKHEFFPFAETMIQNLTFDGRYGTAQSYDKAVTSLKNFLSVSKEYSHLANTLTIEDIDENLVERYNHYLSARAVIRNSVSFYNRTLRSIYNKAVRLCRIPDLHPFDDSYTGVDRTRSRAMSEREIAAMLSLDLSCDPSLAQTRDLFIFSYATRGMVFVDMAYLKKSNLHGSYLTYVRKKTGVRMDVRIEPQVREILNRYSRKDSEYLLPILQGSDKRDSMGAYLCYQSRLSIYNKKLKEISLLLKSSVSLSSYVARHSWATAARNSQTSMSVISEGLGHSSERMTRIYLGEFDSKLIDDANRKLLSHLRRTSVSPRFL